MRVLSGKNVFITSQDDFQCRLTGFGSIHIDIGTGSGRFVLKNAVKNPECFYIGVDPVPAQMAESAIKIQKQKIKNALFIAAPVEDLPPELKGVASSITVILPWGSLRDGIIKADPMVLNGLRMAGKPDTALAIWVGYEEEREAAEVRKRGLPLLSESYLTGLAEKYVTAGILLQNVSCVENSELRSLESDWAKRLAFGPPRRMYRLDCRYF